MSQKVLSQWLKIIISLIAVCSIAVYFFFTFITIWLGMLLWDSLPASKNLSSLFLEFWTEARTIFTWPVLILTTAIPIFISLVFAWKIASDIGKGQLSSLKNAKRLRNISVLAAADVTWFFAANIILLIFNLNHPSIVILSFFILLFGALISITFSVFSYFTQKSYEDLQSVNNLSA